MGFHGLLSAFRGKFVVLRGRLNAKGCRSSSPQAALFLISNLSVPNGVKLLRQVLARFLNLFFFVLIPQCTIQSFEAESSNALDIGGAIHAG
jgi:hypothetical protein